MSIQSLAVATPDQTSAMAHILVRPFIAHALLAATAIATDTAGPESVDGRRYQSPGRANAAGELGIG